MKCSHYKCAGFGKKNPATSGLICGNSTIVARPLHLLGVGRRDGGERGGLCGIRGVAEGLGILETGHVGTEAREQAVVRPRLLGGGGNLAAALDNVAEVIRGAHSLAPPGRELAFFVEKPDADDVSHAHVAGASDAGMVGLEAVLVDPLVRALVPHRECQTAPRAADGGQHGVALAADAVVVLGVVHLLEGAGGGHRLVDRVSTGNGSHVERLVLACVRR